MADILNHLRALEKQGEDNIWRTAKEAREEIERLRAALKPFADHPDFHAHSSWAVTYLDDAHEVPGVTAGDFQRAKAMMGHNVKLRGAPLLARPSRTPC